MQGPLDCICCMLGLHAWSVTLEVVPVRLCCLRGCRLHCCTCLCACVLQVLYGTTELLGGEEFLHQLEELGRRSGILPPTPGPASGAVS